jgi:hypothetical protein
MVQAWQMLDDNHVDLKSQFEENRVSNDNVSLERLESEMGIIYHNVRSSLSFQTNITSK